MKQPQEKQAPEMRYLLGRLTEEDATRLEEHYFADDDEFEEIEIAEDELIDSYVRDKLSPSDCERFEKALVNSERLAERVEFARLLSKSVSSRTFPVKADKDEPLWSLRQFWLSLTDRPAFTMALAVCLLVVVVGGVALIFEWRRLREESTILRGEQAAIEQQKQELARQAADQQSRTGQLDAELQNERFNQELQDAKEQLTKTRRTPVVPAIASILLFSGSSRGGDGNQLTVQPSARTIELKLSLDADDYKSYRVSIRSPNREVLSQDHVRAQGPHSARIILIQMKSNLLSSGDYSVKVSGLTPAGKYESVADYSIRVSKK